MTKAKSPPPAPPGPPPPADLLEAVRGGDPRQVLEALRDRLAISIELALQAEGRDLKPVAPLAKQLRDTLAALAAITPAEAGSPVDQIAKRRAARLAAAKVPTRAARKVVGGSGSDRPGGKRGADPRRPPAARAERSAGRKT